MKIKDWINQLLDLTVIFSFDRSGFKRHCPDELKMVNLSGCNAIVTGATSGIGLAAVKWLTQAGMHSQVIGRDPDKLEKIFKSDFFISSTTPHLLNMADLQHVYRFARNDVTTPIDLLIHNAGGMPESLTITKDGFEEMFASQVIGPFILTKTLADLGRLRPNCRIIFVSSGGMYLQKLDLSDLNFKNKNYNKYSGYANAKRAQVILCEMFSKKYREYLFSSMHPGWVDTPGVRSSMPIFKRLLNKRLRSPQEGADTILWLATADDYPNGKFWFDRKQAKDAIFNLNRSKNDENEFLWKYCHELFESVKEK